MVEILVGLIGCNYCYGGPDGGVEEAYDHDLEDRGVVVWYGSQGVLCDGVEDREGGGVHDGPDGPVVVFFFIVHFVVLD